MTNFKLAVIILLKNKSSVKKKKKIKKNIHANLKYETFEILIGYGYKTFRILVGCDG